MEPKPDGAQPEPSRRADRRSRSIFREVKARFDAALRAGDRLRRAADLVLVEPFLRLGRSWCRAWPAATSARRSAPHVLGRFADMLLASAGHPAMLFYLDNSRSIGPKSVAGLRQHARAEREPRARDPRAAYARRALGLHAGRRDQLRQGADRLDHHSGGDQSGARRRVRVQSAHARAGTADRGRQGLSRRPASSRAAPCSPIIARHPATAAHVARKLARHFVRRRAAAGAGRAAGEALPRHRRRPQGDRQGAGRGAGNLERAAHQAQAAERMADLGLARDRRRAATALRGAAGDGLSGRADVAADRAARASPTCRRPGSTGSRSGSISRTASPNWCRRASSRTASSRPRSGRSRRPKRARPIARAESRQQALTLALMSPEFQRR